MRNDDAFDIPGLIHDFHEAGDFDRVPTYSEVWRAAAGARIPAHRVGRVWMIHKQDRARVAEALGLTRRPVAA
jgi:hypothetical protein